MATAIFATHAHCPTTRNVSHARFGDFHCVVYWVALIGFFLFLFLCANGHTNKTNDV
ncbi:hypothetical protein OKW37_005545 [Paraburkholderia sp. MM5482-R2]